MYHHQRPATFPLCKTSRANLARRGWQRELRITNRAFPYKLSANDQSRSPIAALGFASNRIGGVMRLAIALLVFVHAIAHALQFADAFRLIPSGGIPHKTTLLDGRLDVGNDGIRLMGMLWFTLAIAFTVGAAGMALGTTWWVNLAGVGAMISLVMTLLEGPRAQIGLWLNVVILTAILIFS
jgi:hypothetical protein